MTRHLAHLGAALATAGVLFTGCTRVGPAGDGSTPVPQVTVGGESDPQVSIGPGGVLAARQAAGIEGCPDTTGTSSTPVPAGGATGATTGQPLPHLVLPCLGGDRQVDLAGLPKGRPWVVNVWAQWCWPCTQEAPYLAEVSKQTRGRVGFLGVNHQDPDPGRVIGFAKHYGLTYPEVSDPKGAARVPLRVGAMPETLFVDAQGRVVHREAGQFTSSAQLRQMITQYLGVTP